MKNILCMVFLAILMALIFFVLSPEKYSNALNAQQINAVKGSMVVIKTIATVDRMGDVVKTEMEGISIAIGMGQLLAETHTTQTPSISSFRTPFGTVSIPQKVLTEKWFIGDTEIKLIGRHRDISLFQTPFIERSLPTPFGNSDLLEIGTDVVVVGWSFGNGINVKTGIVSMFITDDKYDPPDKSIKDITIMITAPINGGDSGSPVLARRNGHYEIVGLVCARIKDHGMGFMLHINFVKEAINEITS